MSGFYRHTTDDEGNPSFDHAPNFVYAPGYTLHASRDHGNHFGWEYHAEAPAWAQPEGAHDLKYHEGDVVTTADGELWESTVDNNVWKPGESGWRPYVPGGPAPWQAPTGAHDAYDPGDIVTHNGQEWESTVGGNVWEPGESAQWANVNAGGGGPVEWVQPAGGHDAYQKDDQVTYNGDLWESTVDGNVWQPGVYGWDNLGPA